MPEPLIVTEYDVKNHNLLLRYLRRVGDRVLSLDDRIGKVERKSSTPGVTLPEIQRELKATGKYPLPVDNLRGVLANPQPAWAKVYSTEPTGQSIQSLYDGQLVVVGTTATGDRLYRVIGGNPNTLRQITPNLSGSVVSVADSDFSIYDNLDNTKILQFQASTIAPATTRTMTIPNVSQILAGRDVDNNFSVSQTLTSTVDGNLIVRANNTNAAGTAAVAGHQAVADTANLRMHAFGSGNTATLFGIIVAGYGSLNSNAGSGILIGTAGAVPVVFGTNNLERARVDSAGLWTFKTPNPAILVKPSAAPAANTLMVATQTSTGGALFSIDSEGDTKAVSLTLNNAGQALLIAPISAPAANTKMLEVQTSTGGSVASIDTEGDFIVRGITASGASTITAGTLPLTINSTSYTGGVLIFDVQSVGTSKFTVDDDGWAVASGKFTCGSILDVGGNATITGTVQVQGAAVIRSGSAAPEGSVSGSRGDIYLRTGIDTTNLYVKQTGDTNSTGWVLK